MRPGPLTSAELLRTQAGHFARVDCLLPEPDLPAGEPIRAMLPDGQVVRGWYLHTTLAADNLARLWAATETYTLGPLVGDTGTAGMTALLDAWRDTVCRLPPPATDSACVVNWPSRDVAASRAFLDHGLVPTVVIAVRTGPDAAARDAGSAMPASGGSASGGSAAGGSAAGGSAAGRSGPGGSGPGSSVADGSASDSSGGSGPGSSGGHAGAGGDLLVRPASMADSAAVIELALGEMRYSSQVGAPAPANATELRTEAVMRRLSDQLPVWLAERDGKPVGLAECSWTDVGPGSPYAHQLPPGMWGYINCLSVRPEARGTGVGAALVRAAHAEFAGRHVVGSFLFYAPTNPLSSVFWPRRGYRPLWTTWEVRPASALR